MSQLNWLLHEFCIIQQNRLSEREKIVHFRFIKVSFLFPLTIYLNKLRISSRIGRYTAYYTRNHVIIYSVIQ